MVYRILRSLVMWAVLAALMAVMALVPTSVAAQAQPENWTPPRTSSGAPDLQGVWDFRSLTPMERPIELEDTSVLTADEAASFAGERAAANAAGIPNSSDLLDPKTFVRARTMTDPSASAGAGQARAWQWTPTG